MTSIRIGRPPILTRAAIAQAVIDVGFADLTIAAVRDRLGVGQTTLYRYAADRDELVRIGLSHLLEHAAWPSREGPWREVLSQHALALWHLWANHPGSATEASRGIVPLDMLRLFDDLAVVLLRQGFTPADSVLACDIVFDLVTDNRRDVEHLESAKSSPGATHSFSSSGSQSDRTDRPDGTDPTPEERQAIHSAIVEASAAEPAEWFTQKLNVALDGVEHALAPRNSREHSPTRER